MILHLKQDQSQIEKKRKWPVSRDQQGDEGHVHIHLCPDIVVEKQYTNSGFEMQMKLENPLAFILCSRILIPALNLTLQIWNGITDRS